MFQKIKKWIEEHKYKLPEDIQKVYIVNADEPTDFILEGLLFGFKVFLVCLILISMQDVILQKLPDWCQVISK